MVVVVVVVVDRAEKKLFINLTAPKFQLNLEVCACLGRGLTFRSAAPKTPTLSACGKVLRARYRAQFATLSTMSQLRKSVEYEHTSKIVAYVL